MNNYISTDHKISASQLFCIMLLCRISAEVIYPTSCGYGSECIAAVLIAESIRFLLALPVLIYSAKGSNFYRAAYKKNRFLGWISSLGAVVLLAGVALKQLLGTAEFASRRLLYGDTALAAMIVTALFAVFIAYSGAEAAARSGVLFLVGAALVTAAVILADIPLMEYREMPQWSGSDTSRLLTDVIERVMRSGEYLLFASLLPYVRTESSRARPALFFALFGALATVGLFAFCCAVLGEFMTLSEYPLAAAAELADISLFKRLDGIFCAVWALCGALRAGVMLLGIRAVVRQLISDTKGQKAVQQNA